MTAGDDPLIEAAGLAKVFLAGGRVIRALDGVDFVVHRGEFIGILGPSGSGKSTLLHILGCLQRPSAGSLRLAGRDMVGCSERERASQRARGLGFVFQAAHLIPELTVLENVKLPFLYRDETEGQATRRAEEAIEAVGLAARRRHRPGELSGGEAQRVAVARALAPAPALILADEPTGSLDPVNAAAVLDIFAERRRQGATLVLVTHEREVAGRCERTLTLRAGRFADAVPS